MFTLSQRAKNNLELAVYGFFLIIAIYKTVEVWYEVYKLNKMAFSVGSIICLLAIVFAHHFQFPWISILVINWINTTIQRMKTSIWIVTRRIFRHMHDS